MDDVLVYRGAVEFGYGVVIIHLRSFRLPSMRNFYDI
jgi:hypothetical protein